MSALCGTTKAQSLRLVERWGILFSEKKRQHMSCATDFLGHSYDTAGFCSTGAFVFDVKRSTRRKALKLLNAHLESSKLSGGQANKLRGLLQWVDSGLAGRPCIGALGARVARQYYEKVAGNAPPLPACCRLPKPERNRWGLLS